MKAVLLLSQLSTLLTCSGRQSPVDIVTANVQEDRSLTALVFSSTWGQAVTDGVFENTGNTVKFTLDPSTPNVTTEMPVGNYRLLQFHLHWGGMTGTGSEHLIDGRRSELEVHFVHGRIGSRVAGSEFAVVGVLADVRDDPVSGVWETLQVSGIREPSNSTAIMNFILSSLLPADRDYYHLPGSLTTPQCDESVQWFVLKDRITVPAAYLTALRGINSAAGTPLTHNFREPQLLSNRTVTSPSGWSRVLTALKLLLMEII